ncbi:MAG: HD domain-containing protein [Methanosphaera sp.]|nr:HD domain-containing protein [Methanosphaera sp.]
MTKSVEELVNYVYKELECSEYIIDHSNTVYERTKDLTPKYNNIDLDLIEAGAKLHDVGRTVTNNIEHAYIGADLLRNLGVDEAICRITERHIGAGITVEDAKENNLPERQYIPQTLEEKIVAHADNLVHGVEFVDLDFVIDKWKNKNMNPEAIDRLIRLDKELR